MTTGSPTILLPLKPHERLTTHDTDTARDQRPYKQEITVFWINVKASPLTRHNVLASLRPMIREAKGTIHPLPEAWAIHESKDAIYCRFWNTWNQTTHLLRHRGTWSNRQFAEVYDMRTNALCWDPQPWLRRLWHLRKYRCTNSNKIGR